MKKFAANNGFTLIELMITLVVVIILVAIAAPSFNSMIRDNRAATQANNLLSSLQLARSEAINRGVQVTMRSNTNNAWEDGWLVFTDWNGDGQIPAANLNLKDCSVDGQDCLLMEQQALGNNITLTPGTNHAVGLTFLPSGEITAAGGGIGTGTFNLCIPDANQRNIVISASGRARIDQGAVCP
ncbi:GspH/FimT family pseudopilin [Methylophaga nitratireducenticrescens]|uniref:GspH/FimT family pseudopilin n=1 Tax=Methylophaga nitratireducenticrescens TaxID=754476 RepID=UPI000CDC0840|nr:GspH/FimT family pseudopilin [Methylophaga nitratireducenticrescens]AUZ85694.1 pilus assembly protein FimT [Methylophaga nitratireducenticrescens]